MSEINLKEDKIDFRKALEGFFVIVGAGLLLAGLIGGLVLVNGFVLSKIWNWVIVPTFDVRELSLIQAVGVALVVGYFTASPKRDEKTGEMFTRLGAKFGISLLMAWIIHFYL